MLSTKSLNLSINSNFILQYNSCSLLILSSTNNIYIERFWCTIKYQHIYLRPVGNGLELYNGIELWIEKYNNKAHQGIGRINPISKYKSVA